LVVDLPEVRWRLRNGPRSRPHGLARGYLYGSAGPGRAWLVVKMDKPVRIARRLTLRPSEDWPFHRLVIDVEEAPVPGAAQANLARSGQAR
jgi:hypothetical protein